MGALAVQVPGNRAGGDGSHRVVAVGLRPAPCPGERRYLTVGDLRPRSEVPDRFATVMGALATAVSDLETLFRAWRRVRAQVKGSSWPQLAAEVGAIEAAPVGMLRSIHERLRAGRYQFTPKWGYARKKSGGSRRGITVHAIADRIVQRAILDVLHSADPVLRAPLRGITAVLDTPTSFAGAPGRGVPEAIALTMQRLRAGDAWFALSDMKDFFPCVPRAEVVAFLAEQIDDEPFVALFRAALETELRNADELQAWLELFPLHERGVAQGSLLSVLVGNLSLRGFDAQLNTDGLTTVRYLDDFVILGSSRVAVVDGFERAVAELAAVGMACYQPEDGSQKAFLGPVADGFDFLGCRVHPDGVAPGRRARRGLLREVAHVIATGKVQIEIAADPAFRRRTEAVYAQTLARIDSMVRGWGDAFRFVTNRVAFAQLDAEIDGLLDEFHGWFARRVHGVDSRTRRRMSGVSLLGDTPPSAG